MFNPVWESIFASRAWGRYPAEDLVRFVAREKAARPDANLKALELGCGPGANLWLLANEGIRFDAIDGSASAVRQAIARLDAEHPGWRGRVIEGDICALPDDCRGYDLVIDSEALSCNSFEDSSSAIAQVHERLLAGGAFWSRTFASGTWGLESGTRVGADFWLASSGPFEGKGPIRVLPRECVESLYGRNWASINVGEITRHDGDATKLVREWIIVARKGN